MTLSKKPSVAIYPNTPENARHIGWAHIPEYVKGDPKLPFVAHDHVKGIFTYVATAQG